ncbi:MAG: cbb3-type cytochrome c oxidase subunit I [Gammaproteobacteria bacterium]|nr:cbb3-type cytochrome c oxidase subunit I [Gammaproteobacteria bacterium]
MTEREKPNGLALSHMWVAMITFLVAAFLGLYQVLERAEYIPAWAEGYYTSVTAHGVIMAYVLTTFFIVGFGYYCASSSLKRPIWSPGLAWGGFLMMLVGVLLVVYAIVTGQGTVLYTFYPPLTAHWTFYVGAALLVVGSIAWIIIMIVMPIRWKRENPGQPLPLIMFTTTANALLWGWTLVGVALEVVFQLIPLSVGWIDSVDVGLAKTLFAWTLHPIVYFWLIPAYQAFYMLVPRVAGGRLFSDEMARVAFIMLLVFSLPIGMHHLYVDPFQAAGWKLFHAFGTFMVAVPTLITGFTVLAGLELAGRLRGGKGLFGWIRTLPWDEPMLVATALALLMLTAGGFGGMINASYGMNTMVHNTMWVPAHFHLIFAGTTIIMYFAIAYHLWPKMTGRELFSKSLAVKQLWVWFIGMLILTIPWHYVGLLGMPRRTALMPYDPVYVDPWKSTLFAMAIGGVVLAVSAVMLIYNLVMTQVNRAREADRELKFAEPIHPVLSLPAPLNGFTLWNSIILIYMIAGWGYPIAQFFVMNTQNALPWGW